MITPWVLLIITSIIEIPETTLHRVWLLKKQTNKQKKTKLITSGYRITKNTNMEYDILFCPFIFN